MRMAAAEPSCLTMNSGSMHEQTRYSVAEMIPQCFSHSDFPQTFEMQRLADQASQIVTEKVFELVMTSDPDISDHSVPIQCGEQTPNHSPTQIYEQLFHLDNEINSRVLRALAQMVGAQKLPVACSESVSTLR